MFTNNIRMAWELKCGTPRCHQVVARLDPRGLQRQLAARAWRRLAYEHRSNTSGALRRILLPRREMPPRVAMKVSPPWPTPTFKVKPKYSRSPLHRVVEMCVVDRNSRSHPRSTRSLSRSGCSAHAASPGQAQDTEPNSMRASAFTAC